MLFGRTEGDAVSCAQSIVVARQKPNPSTTTRFIGVSFGKESAHTNKIRRPEWTGNPIAELTFCPARRIGLCRRRRCDTVSIRPAPFQSSLAGREAGSFY